MSDVVELLELPAKETALAVFSTTGGLDPYMGQIRGVVDAFVPDVSTTKGREAIASMAHKIARAKTALDGVGKDVVAELKELPKRVDKERKRMRDTLDQWRDEVRMPLTEWERIEDERVAAHKAKVDALAACAQALEGKTVAQLRAALEQLQACEVDESWQEFEPEGHHVKAGSLETLQRALAARETYEAEQAELARLRAEAEARAKRDEEERTAREAAEQAVRAAQAEQERLKAAVEEAERQRLEAIAQSEERARLAVEAERKRVADEQARQDAEALARSADVARHAAVNRAALDAFMKAGFYEDDAKYIVTLIAKGQIPAVSITY